MHFETILCICISTYNRAERVEKLVLNILKCQSEKLSVVVVDDNSIDDTRSRLVSIKDKRLHVYKNEVNLGAKENWFETIDKGMGKFILHLLDRDWLDYRYLESLIEILENTDAGFGYVSDLHNISWKLDTSGDVIEDYHKGEETIKAFAFNWAHPSGFLVKKIAWEIVKDKKIFYDTKYGTYPHAYIYALLSCREKGIVIRYRMISISSSVNFVKNKSRFYQKTKLAYYWTPMAWERELYAVTDFCCRKKLWNKQLIQNVLKIRFRDSLYHATINYKKCAMNPETCMHYNVEKKYVTNSELFRVNAVFMLNYIKFVFVKRLKIVDIPFCAAIIKIGLLNLKDIIGQI